MSAKAKRHSRPQAQDGNGSERQRVTRPPRDRDVGHALRSIYQKTVDEDVPSDLLDLLGKLG